MYIGCSLRKYTKFSLGSIPKQLPVYIAQYIPVHAFVHGPVGHGFYSVPRLDHMTCSSSSKPEGTVGTVLLAVGDRTRLPTESLQMMSSGIICSTYYSRGERGASAISYTAVTKVYVYSKASNKVGTRASPSPQQYRTICMHAHHA